MSSKIVTFILGNGFDLQMGLKTRYSDFYKTYSKPKDTDKEHIKKFKEILKNPEWETWADFELGMGKYSNEFDGDKAADNFAECISDFTTNFNSYLEDQCSKVDFSTLDVRVYKKFEESVSQFYNLLGSEDSSKMRAFLGSRYSINFLQFNYTNIFYDLIINGEIDKNLTYPVYNNVGHLLKNHCRIENILHIHGKMGKNGNMVMGVNDTSQILNPNIRENKIIQHSFVKHMFLDYLQEQNINFKTDCTKAIQIINGSDVICTFGASIGDTDKRWWQEIGKRLVNEPSSLLIIFDIYETEANGIDPILTAKSKVKRDEQRDYLYNQFKKLSELDDEWFENNYHRIIIELNTNLFGFKLISEDES